MPKIMKIKTAFDERISNVLIFSDCLFMHIDESMIYADFDTKQWASFAIKLMINTKIILVPEVCESVN